MEAVGDAVEPRYRAFISYSHRDAAFGRRLHGRLESYALPRRLVGRPGRQGPVPGRLSPIFRDREELSAADDLSAEVRAALAQSATLIVVCSPAAAASAWVGREIEAFRAMHPGRPVLAALIGGEPEASFPAALRANGGEPLAADFRREGDGPRLALLKLAAGVAGVGLDELVQRDAQRRVARVTAVTAVALAATLVMAVMTGIALDARAEADRQRAEAEGLVEFMLTDLREKLRGVGRLDVMTAVNQRALDHYADQDLKRLSPNELERRAKVLHAMGEDDMTRGRLDRALAQFEEARRTTAALLAASPDDPDRIFAHSQSEFWVASIDYEKGRYELARKGFEAYRVLAGRLVAIAPTNIEYRRELGFAEGNLCSLALMPPVHAAAALRHCALALATMEVVAESRPGDDEIAADLVNRHAWMADAYAVSGATERALTERLVQERLLDRLISKDPRNVAYRETWVALQRALSTLELKRRDRPAAILRLAAAKEMLKHLTGLDSNNELWKRHSIDVSNQLENLRGENDDA